MLLNCTGDVLSNKFFAVCLKRFTQCMSLSDRACYSCSHSLPQGDSPRLHSIQVHRPLHVVCVFMCLCVFICLHFPMIFISLHTLCLPSSPAPPPNFPHHNHHSVNIFSPRLSLLFVLCLCTLTWLALFLSNVIIWLTGFLSISGLF